MADLIDRAALKRDISAEYDLNYGEILIDPWRFFKMVEDAPAVDAVKVVRCEKCRYSQALPANRESAFGVGVRCCRKGRGNNINPFGLSTVSKDDFCSCGERVIENA